MNESITNPLNSTEILAASSYTRERIEPSYSGLFYLTLTDLKELIARNAPHFKGSIIDYGCGGAPYKPLFTKVRNYVRADMLPGPEIDLVLEPNGLTEEPTGSYQGVVSFQVLEHVPDPAAYLDECSRLLEAGGLLLLTTHGHYLEHKCPNDYYRWTAQGLEHLVASRGFVVEESYKLTVGLRGALQLMHYIVEEFRHDPQPTRRFFLRVFRKIYNEVQRPILNFLGRRFLGNEGISPGTGAANLYIGVGIRARKI